MKFLKLLLPPTVALGAFLYFAIPLPVLAANGTLFITPRTGTFAPGSSFTIEIRADSGNAYRQVTRANITYPNHLLEAVSSTSYGSDFAKSNTSIRHDAGVVTYTAYDITPPKGSNLYAYKVKFKVLAKGNAKISFASDSAVNGAPANLQSASYKLQPPAKCPPGQSGTPPNCSPAPNPTPAPNPAPTPSQPRPSQPRPSAPSRPSGNTNYPPAPMPDISPDTSHLLPIPVPPIPDVEEPIISEEPVDLPDESEDAFGIGNIRTKTLYDTSTIFWESNRPGGSTLSYGTTSDNLDNTATVIQESPTSYSAKLTKLKPGVKYFYSISSVDASDTSVTDEYQTSFVTKGYPVKIIVLHNDQPVKEASVSLKDYNGNTVTGEQGNARLELKEGTYTVMASKDDLEAEQEITVEALSFESEGIPDTQNVEIKLSGGGVAGGTGGIVALVLVLLFLLFAGIVVAIIFIRKKRAQAAAASGYQSIIEDDWTPNTTYVNPATGEFNIPPPPGSFPQPPPSSDVPENEYFADLGDPPPR